MKIFKRAFFILFLLLLLAYVTNITSIPDSILLFKGEKLNLGIMFGLYVKESNNNSETVTTATTLSDIEKVEKSTVEISLFNLFPVKEVNVNTIPNTKVVPLGNTVGLKLYTEGVLVVGMTDINGKKPYENSGIEEGDMIIKINEKAVSSTAELIECVNRYGSKEIEVGYLRDGEEKETNMSPVKTESNEYKLGLWVRDGAARNWNYDILWTQYRKVCSITDIGIVDADTTDLIQISTGEIVGADITNVVKGEKGKPRRNKGLYF